MPVTTKITKLEAVNEMLSVIGEAPVSSLLVTGRTDVAIAKQFLDNVIVELCEEGWHWNTDTDYQLALDGAGKIAVPLDALRVDAHYHSVRVVERNGFLWDLDDHTFTFSQGLRADIVRAFDWDSLPQAARTYAMVRASRRFAKRMLGDADTTNYTNEDMGAARTQLEKAEDDSSDANMLGDPALLRMTHTNR